MRLDAFQKHFRATERYINIFIAGLYKENKFDFSARSSPQFINEENQQKEVQNIVDRFNFLINELTELRDKIQNKFVFNNTYDRTKWSLALFSQEQIIAKQERERQKLFNTAAELEYLNDLNFSLKTKLIALEGEEHKGKFVWIDSKDNMLYNEPVGWNWGIVETKFEILIRLYETNT